MPLVSPRQDMQVRKETLVNEEGATELPLLRQESSGKPLTNHDILELLNRFNRPFLGRFNHLFAVAQDLSLKAGERKRG